MFLRYSERLFSIASLLLLLVLGSVATPASLRAEGSRELVDFEISQGGNVRYGLVSSDNSSSVPGWVVFLVYAEAGETIHLGSNTIHTADGNIYLWDPATPVASEDWPGPLFASALVDCVAQAAGDTTLGLIDTRAKEIAGPEASPGDGGYVSCRHEASVSGLYSVFFRAIQDTGASPDNMPADDPMIGTQATIGVHAWDVTVRDASGIDQPGRLMSSWLRFYETGGGGPDQQLFVLTRDGHQYRARFDEVNGIGFAIFSNNKGVQVTATGEPTYRSWQTADANSMSDPQFFHRAAQPDTEDDVTNKLFVNPPDTTAVTGPGGLGERLDYRAAPDFLPGPTGFLFDASASGGGVATAPNGFTDAVFTFESDPSLDGIRYQLVIDTDRNGSFEDAVDRRLGGVFDSAGNSVAYDGEDAVGDPLDPDSAYTARVQGTGAEVHFPLSDVEGFGGMQIERLTNPSAGNVFRAAYDDFNEVALTGAMPVSLPGGGDSSVAGFHSWGGNSGNTDLVDTWAFTEVTGPAETQFVLGSATFVADLELVKEASSPSVSPGETFFYDLTVLNHSDSVPAPGVVVTDILPEGLTLVATTGCLEDPVGVPTCTLGTVEPLGSASYSIEVMVAGETGASITNTAQVSSEAVDDPIPANDTGTAGITLGTIVDVPTLDVAGLLVLALLAASTALWKLRRT